MQTAKKSVYLQIVDDTKRQIELGILAEGDKLPSCRELAVSLGVNPNTVQRAYAQLEEEGYIYTLPKKGVYVSPRQKKERLEQIAREKLTELKNAGFTKGELVRMIFSVYGERDD